MHLKVAAGFDCFWGQARPHRHLLGGVSVFSLQAPSHKYSAHSSHVTNVSFTHDDGHLISTGGKDMSIIQWRLVEKLPLPPSGPGVADPPPARAPESKSQSPELPAGPLAEAEEGKPSGLPAPVENSLEPPTDPSQEGGEDLANKPASEPSEEQSGEGGEDLGDEPAWEPSEVPGTVTGPQDQSETPPLP